MNFSIHLDDATALRLKLEAARRNRTRNAVVAEAVKQWLERSQRSDWPKELLQYAGARDLVPFEKARSKKKERPRFP
ncbi:MAG: hypothetical protein H6Q89_4427 [Myxococcaceae bacterium]|nr:hypothetical protein [Myxococcaceae bacterium]